MSECCRCALGAVLVLVLAAPLSPHVPLGPRLPRLSTKGVARHLHTHPHFVEVCGCGDARAPMMSDRSQLS